MISKWIVCVVLLSAVGCTTQPRTPSELEIQRSLYLRMYEDAEKDLLQCEEDLTTCQEKGGSLLPHIE
jgi:hypothetical protein